MAKKALPKLIKRDRGLHSKYSIMLTIEMKKALEELKTFQGIDVPEWIRMLIQQELDSLK